MAGSGPCERQGSSAPVGLEFAACTPAHVDNTECCGKGVPMPAVARSGALHAHTDQQPESKPQPEDPPGRVGAGPVPVEQPRQALATTSRELSDGFVLCTSGPQPAERAGEVNQDLAAFAVRCCMSPPHRDHHRIGTRGTSVDQRQPSADAHASTMYRDRTATT